DKANVLATSRLWRERVTEVAKSYPNVQLEYMFVDNAAMKIITNPSHFDVVLTENLFGDIITDEASVIAGSLGLLPSASIGEKYMLFEPIHGSYPEVAGKSMANPLAAILSAAMLLEHAFRAENEAQVIRKAVDESMEKGYVTSDIDPDSSCTTREVGDFIVEKIYAYQSKDPASMTII
ncbi:MAG: isocitrate/isopropylmalate family dehydrogenase, partial [Cyclobacteriaceae bacterium]|nr:isocitrate/isopropylmalate family dehydrogenase [Cyclobacteriaceae bacterium]